MFCIQNDDIEWFHHNIAFIILHMVACTKDNRDWLHEYLQLVFYLCKIVRMSQALSCLTCSFYCIVQIQAMRVFFDGEWICPCTWSLGFPSRNVMALRYITIVMVNGASLLLAIPHGKVFVLDLMREIRSKLHLSKREQRILFEGTILKACDEIPAHHDLVLTLVSVPPNCVFCFIEQTYPQTLLYCSRCRHVTYCGQICQRSDWRRHRKFCTLVSTCAPCNEQ